MCLILLLVNLVTFQVTSAGILKVRKRSVEGNASTMLNDSPGVTEVFSRFANDPNEAVSRFRNILPIWWHYFLPMVQITMQDDNLRQELQKTYEHESDSVEVSNDEQMLQSSDFGSSMNNSPPDDHVGDHVSNENSMTVPNINIWGSANSVFTGKDDPNERQETKIRHDTTEMDNNVEQFTGTTDDALEMSVNEGTHNEAINTFANFEPGVSDETSEVAADDVKVGQEIDNSETVGNTEDPFVSSSNDEQSNEIMSREEFEITTGDIDNRFTDSIGIFEQPSHDEVDTATMSSGLIDSEVNNAIWNNNFFATNFESTLSEGTFDDQIVRSHHHNEVLSSSDDISSIHDVSEHPLNMNDGAVGQNPWMFPREENRATDSDFVPSFMSSMPFFASSSRSSESDSSS